MDAGFSQSDVDGGRLWYYQSDMTYSGDEFVVNVRDRVNEVVDVAVVVVVRARLSIRDDVVTVSGDEPFHITVDLLDASDLAELTGADPEYEVIIHSTYYV